MVLPPFYLGRSLPSMIGIVLIGYNQPHLLCQLVFPMYLSFFHCSPCSSKEDKRKRSKEEKMLGNN